MAAREHQHVLGYGPDAGDHAIGLGHDLGGHFPSGQPSRDSGHSGRSAWMVDTRAPLVVAVVPFEQVAIDFRGRAKPA
jgi:hypothetical protein